MKKLKIGLLEFISLIFTKDYYTSHKINTFYPFVEVSFELSKDQKHYHVPITLSPFGYSTYRGS